MAAVLAVVSIPLALMAILPTTVALNACRAVSVERICQLSSTGKSFLVYVPMIAVFGASAAALGGSVVADRKRLSARWGLLFWAAGLITAAYSAIEFAHLL